MKDFIFTIYKYKIDKIPEGEGYLYEEHKNLNPKDYATKEEFFESFLPDKMKILDLWDEVHNNQSGEETVEKDAHKNYIMEHRDNIIVIAVQANKQKSFHNEDWEEDKVDNHPPCLLIFDNRPGHQFVAIQKAAMDTDKTAKILFNSFNYLLNKYDYKFEIFRLKREMQFLEAVYDIKRKLNDRISKVVFDFKKNQETQKTLSKRFVHKLTEWIGKFADSGQVSANISNDEKLKYKTVQKDLELMATLCSSNANYNLLVKFAHFGIFRYGQDVKAQFGLEESVLESFLYPPTDKPKQLSWLEEEEDASTITLTQWLDKVHTLYHDYEEEALSVKKRRRSNRL